LALVGAMVLAAAPEISSESLTLSTYYPPPSGAYTQLVGTSNAYIARDAGYVGAGTPTPDSLAGSKFTIDPSAGGYGTAFTIQNTAAQAVMAINPFGTGGWVMFDGSNGWNATIYEGGTVATAGKVGIAGAPVAPYALTVNGSEQVTGYMTAAAYEPPYAGWATLGPGPSGGNTGDGGAAIYNDGAAYQALMVVGNNSNGSGRQVAVWDELNVNGTLVMNPGVGNIVVPINDCGFVAYGAGINGCGGNQYATLTSGVDTKYMMIQDSEDPSGVMLCCTCPFQRIDNNGNSGGFGTANGNCPSF
jgi:hypothetical protein